MQHNVLERCFDWGHTEVLAAPSDDQLWTREMLFTNMTAGDD